MRSDWGWESNGAEGDPKFKLIGTNGFQLTANSPNPLIGGGVDLSSIFNYDKNNMPRISGNWDLGAYIYYSGLKPNSPNNLRIE